MADQSISKRIAAMRDIVPEKEYYALTLTASEEGRMVWATISHWEGFSNETMKREIRAASIVRPERIAELWHSLKRPYVVVNNKGDLLLYLLIGGNALIERSIAEVHLPDAIRPEEVAPSGPMGFKCVKGLPEYVQNRAPTPKQRMRILKRDNYRCKICGRRSTNHVDVELHVHHIRPWARGGLTEDENLITLCHTCHKGLDPHEEYDLFFLLDPDEASLDAEVSRRELFEGIRRYRQKVRALLAREQNRKQKKHLTRQLR